MTQHKPPQAMTLFDLIGRNWDLGTPVDHVAFNAAGSSVAARLRDGRLAFVSVKDAEHPESRIRVEADTGRPSIRPRSKPLPPPVTSAEPAARPDVPLCRLGAQGFAFAGVETGAHWRATARGQILAVKAAEITGITAQAAVPARNAVALASGAGLVLVADEGGARLAETRLSHEITRMSLSTDEKHLACWGQEQVTIVSTDGLAVSQTISCPGDLADLAWSPCGRWLAGGCLGKAMVLVDLDAGSSDRVVGFPQAVRRVAFSASSDALVAAGAFRVVGWKLPDLPFGDHEGTPVETGKPGLTAIDLVAAHPGRDLCAVSYANGLVVICRIGHPDEMMLREGTGAPVNTLVWSDDGEHLAIGAEDGNLSITTFPKNMFK